MVGRDGRGLEALPVESERPFRYLYIKGVTPLTAELGKTVLDERSLAIVLELCEAFESAGLDGVGVIDLTDKTDIRLDWKNQITIALGNDSNLTYEVRVAVTSLPVVQRRHGATARGELDIRMYADPSVTSPMIIFTSEISSGDDPASVLPYKRYSLCNTGTNYQEFPGFARNLSDQKLKISVEFRRWP